MIYFIEAEGAGLLKIGFTDRDPGERLRELQTGCPHKLRLVAVDDTEHATIGMERIYHEDWGHLRQSGEWFRIDPELRWFIYWLKYGRPEAASMAHDVRGDVALFMAPYAKFKNDTGSIVQEQIERGVALQERNEYLEDQVRRLWAAVEDLTGFRDRLTHSGEDLRHQADCRM